MCQKTILTKDSLAFCTSYIQITILHKEHSAQALNGSRNLQNHLIWLQKLLQICCTNPTIIIDAQQLKLNHCNILHKHMVNSIIYAEYDVGWCILSIKIIILLENNVQYIQSPIILFKIGYYSLYARSQKYFFYNWALTLK